MEKLFDEKTLKKEYFNINLFKIIIDYLNLHEKFKIIQILKWNTKLLDSLSSIFLANDLGLKYKINKGLFKKTTEFISFFKDIYDINAVFRIKFISPDFIFKYSKGSIDSNCADFIFSFVKNIIRDQSNFKAEELKYLPINVS